jgi:hypothetical protein
MGFPVPWSVSWSSEKRYEVRICRWAYGRRAIWQPHSPGVGLPIFAKPHNVRQRMAVRKMLCPHCGKPTSPDDRWWFSRGRFIEGFYMTTDIPLHHECALISAQHCPILKRDGDKLRRWPDGAQIALQIVGGAAVENDFGLKLSPEHPAVGHLKFAWPEHRIRREPSLPAPTRAGSEQ